MENKLACDFAKDADPEFRVIVEAIVDTIEKTGRNLDCAMKWGQLTFALHEDFHHWIMAIKVTKKFVGLVFHYGGLLDDPGNVFIIGDSKFGRKIEYRRIEEVEPAVIVDLLEQALDKLEYFKANWKTIQAG